MIVQLSSGQFCLDIELVAQVNYFDHRDSLKSRNHLIGHGNATRVPTQPGESDTV